MRRVLFVDDEPHVLDGLRDLLRKDRKRWDMVFAPGGAAALAELEKASFDVVVSDMRMPVIDGASLLTRVKELYPATARIILSGHAERESIVRALPVTHQFLSKPCDAGLLRIVVERACELQKLLQHDRIRDVIGKLDKLPSVPQTYWELTRAAAREDVALAHLSEIVESDPAMTVKVLQLVNSAYFGLPQRLSSARQAVSYLGVDLLKALALSVHAFGTMKVKSMEGFSLETLQQHSLLTARLAKKMLPDPKAASDAFTAALVHDIGKIVLAVGVPEIFERAVRESTATGQPTQACEKDLLGVTHAEVGAYLLGFWGLPLTIVEAVAYHHCPSVLADGTASVLGAVHVADALLEGQLGRREAGPHQFLDMAFLERLGVQNRIEEYSKMADSILASPSVGATR